MRSCWLAVALAVLAPYSWGQDIVIRIYPDGPAAGRMAAPGPGTGQPSVTVTQGNILITVTVEPGLPAPSPPTPTDPAPVTPDGQAGATDADFAGSSRMYIRGIPLALRQVAGRVGTDIKTMDELSEAIDAARKRANNGLARRLAVRWAGAIAADGTIVNPKPIVDSLNQAAAAMEAGLR